MLRMLIILYIHKYNMHLQYNIFNEISPLAFCDCFLYPINCHCIYRGVGAMEIVAMDMKLRGMYMARQLSFAGVTFQIQEIPLTREFVEMYDASVALVSFSTKFTATVCYNSQLVFISFSLHSILVCRNCINVPSICD